MFCFRYIAHPNPDNEEHAGTGGAYVNCFIDYADYEGGKVLALHYIRREKWIPDTFDAECEIDEPDDENRQYFFEAKEFGYCLVFHTWPVDATDDGEDWKGEEARPEN